MTDKNLSLKPIPCPVCKKEFIPEIDVLIPGYRGKMIRPHGCGENMPFRVYPVDPEKVAIWETLRNGR